jgi:pyruvate formate lyase activating enzyme
MGGVSRGGCNRVKVNFGSFVPLSTVDWRGRAVCTVFLRGCPIRCSYCQNSAILSGEDYREINEVIEMIRSSAILVSGVVFSGGEPTMQKEALLTLCEASKVMGLAVGIQTNGVFPGVLDALISRRLADRVAIDLKTSWERYSNRLKGNYLKNVRRSISLCREARDAGQLPELELVFTLFRGDVGDIDQLGREAEGVPLVLQQGEHKRYWEFWKLSKKIDGVAYLTQKDVRGDAVPLTLDELKHLADRIGRDVRIRTREDGEVSYAGHRDHWPPRKRKG